MALDWTVRLWTDPSVEWVRYEVLGDVDGKGPTPVDDVVVGRRDGRIYVQAKKTHPSHGTWTPKTAKLKPELVKARDQLAAATSAEVWFYSQSPFGRLSQLSEQARAFSGWTVFIESAPAKAKQTLRDLATVLSVEDEEAFGLVRRMAFRQTLGFEAWDRDLIDRLGRHFARPVEVAELLASEITARQARLRSPQTTLTRADLSALLAERGHHAIPTHSEADLLTLFRRASRRGRTWTCTVGGESFPRPEADAVESAVRGGASAVVVTSPRGGGKTCVLLDIVDRLEADEGWAVLYIKGTEYAGAETHPDLAERGLPEDIVGAASKLSASRRVAVVLDALDVLSLDRESATLSLLLALLDTLTTVDGVSVIAACRDFDLDYAPELRGRSWDVRIRLSPIPTETVAAVLSRWGLDADALDPELLDGLRVPEHLRLFHSLVQRGVTDIAGGPYALHERFLSEVVDFGPGLGAEAAATLETIAGRMQQRRRTELPLGAVPGGRAAVRGLLSANVLREPRQDVVEFAHQELLDAVVVRRAVREGDTLASFLRATAPLPFVRPTARTFFFLLRAHDPATFRRDVRAVVDDTKIAYHLRRLVAESLAEIVPTDDDLPLVRHLFRQRPDLGGRLLRRVESEAWRDILLGFLPRARAWPDGDDWTARLLGALRRWTGRAPGLVLGAWEAALLDGAVRVDERGDALWEATGAIGAALDGVRDGGAPPPVAGRLLRLLLEHDALEEHHRHDLATLVRRWVEATDGDDDMVWRVLEAWGADGDPEIGDGLFHRGGVADLTTPFLVDRLCRSDALAGRVLDALGAVYDHTSERDRLLAEVRGGYRGVSGEALLGPLGEALVWRARRDDPWFREREAGLRSHPDPALRSLVLEVYARDPERHAAGLGAVFSDPEFVLGYPTAPHVRELAARVYPFLSTEAQDAHQRMVLGTLAPDDPADRRRAWHAKRAYGLLLWIPSPWRGDDATAFVDAWRSRLGAIRPVLDVDSGQGGVADPFRAEDLIALSDVGVVRLVEFFGTSGRWQSDGWGEHVGGWDQAVSVFQQAADRAPVRMLDLLDVLLKAGAPPPYPDAIVHGAAWYLQRVFGRLSKDGWSPLETDVDGRAVARRLLRIVERHADVGVRDGYSQAPTWTAGGPWLSRQSHRAATEGCAHALADEVDLARLTLLLVRQSRSPDPDIPTGRGAAVDAWNTVRGEAASAAGVVTRRLLERGTEMPDLLVPMLQALASDPVPGVRHGVVEALPHIAHHRADLGWELAGHALREPDTEVWTAAGWLFYSQYHAHFDRVADYLPRMAEAAPETYGRIAALCGLAGHFDLNGFIDDLAGRPPATWKGVVGVLVANLRFHRAMCARALERLVTLPGLPKEAAEALDRGLEKDVRPLVPGAVIAALIARGEEADGDPWTRWQRVALWVAEAAARDPRESLPLLERLYVVAEKASGRGFYSARESLVCALNAVLRDADMSDDESYIRRAVALQDAFDRLGIVDVEAMLAAAARD